MSKSFSRWWWKTYLDILRDEFKREPSSSRAKNRQRNFRCLIIDEVDSICINNLGASTRLSEPFPSYDFLKILYPYIYKSLNIIDNTCNRGFYGEFKDEKLKEEFIVSELEKTIKEIIEINKNNPNGQFIIPNNLKNFITLQLREWCFSAYQVKYYYRENYHYVFAKEENDPERMKYLKSMGFVPKLKYKISPVDFANTGVMDFINFFKLNMD